MKGFVKEFKQPSNRYGAVPFWFLNGDLTREELIWQVEDMKKKGLGGYVMHSRYGRRIDYFSEEFFDRIGTIIEKSEELGMSAIVYDEDDWPSGMTGTKVIDDHPEYKHKQMEFVYLDVTGKDRVNYTPDKGTIFKAYACKFSTKSDKREECIVSQSKDITPSANTIDFDFNGEKYDSVVVFVFQEVNGYTLYTTFPTKKGFRAQPDTWSWYFPFGEYVDLLNPDVVSYFIETTCEEYKRRFGKHFGKAIQYFFTDEPGFYTVMRDNDSAVAWSDIFCETFKERKGYDIKDNMLVLAYEAGGNTRRIRYDYYEHLTHLFEHNFVKQYSDWCKDNGIHLTGHYRLCYPQLVWQRNYSGNIMNMFRQMDAPGTDRLDTPGMNDTFATKDWSWQVEDKLCSSIAHQYDISRCMTESFALGGWEYRFADMKRVTDWQYMMGMNMMVPHAFHYSISGQRKKECIPSFFYQNPTWQNYGKYSEYLCRLGEMLIGGKHICDIAILYPMTTIWADDIPQKEVQDTINNIDRDFSHITDTLLRRHLDYDVIAEDELSKVEIKNGAMNIGSASYKLMIIPPMITIRKETEEQIKAFVDAGGKVLFLSMPPRKTIDDEALPYFEGLFDAKVLKEANENYVNQAKVDAKVFDLASGIKFITAGVLKDNAPNDEIVSAIESLIERDVKITIGPDEGGVVYYNHFTKEDCDIVFIHNSNEDMAHDVKLDVRATKKNAYIFDSEDGSVLTLEKASEANGRTTFELYLDQLKSYFIVMSDDEIEANGVYNITALKPASVGTKELGDEWKNKILDPNALIIDTWKMVQNEPKEDTTLASWDSGFGTVIKFTSEFTIKDGVGDLELVIDRNSEMIYEGEKQPIVYRLNGKEITNFVKSDFLDHDMYKADISAFCKNGVNELSIEYVHSMFAFEGKTGINSVGMMWDSSYIIGDFTLEKNDSAMNRYDIVAPRGEIKTGSWAPQGYPYFNGCMEYVQEVDLEVSDDCRYILDMGDIRETVEVLINDKMAGARVWMPYTLDITDFVKNGCNKIALRVRNTPKNIMEKCNWDCGIMDRVVVKTVK